MPNTRTKSALEFALGFLLINPAAAVPFTPPHTSLGSFTFDNDVEELEFSIGTNAIVTIETICFLGGLGVTDPVIPLPGGGFDPILTLFDSTGTVLAIAEDDIDFLGGDLDERIDISLDTGTYTVAVMQTDKFFKGVVGDNISLGFDFPRLGFKPSSSRRSALA